MLACPSLTITYPNLTPILYSLVDDVRCIFVVTQRINCHLVIGSAVPMIDDESLVFRKSCGLRANASD